MSAEETVEVEKWRKLALHALSDLRTIGVDITKMADVGMTPEIVAEVDAYSRSMESFS